MSAGMKVEFSELLRGFAASQERAAAASAPDPAGEVLALAGRVRRRRLIRAGTAAAAGAAAVLVGAVAVYGLTRPEPVPPASPSPTPVQTSTPTEEPTEEPTAEPTQEPVLSPVTEHALLPEALPLPDGVFASTTADWLLGRYQASRTNADGSAVTSPSVLYLVAPDGARYEVPVPDEVRPPESSGDYLDWRLTDWLPGSSRAVIGAPTGEVVEGDYRSEELAVVDLATGEVSLRYDGSSTQVVLLPGGDLLVVTYLGNGARLAELVGPDGHVKGSLGPFEALPWEPGASNSSGWAVDPTRSRLLLDTPQGLSLFELDELRQMTVPQVPAPALADTCAAYSWLDADRYVVRCDHGQAVEGDVAGQDWQLWLVTLDGSAPTWLTAATTPDSYQAVRFWLVGGTIVAERTQALGSTCGQGIVQVLGDGTQAVVPGAEQFAVAGVSQGRLLGWNYSCEAGGTVGLVALDVATGQMVSLVPRVDAAQDASYSIPVGDFSHLQNGWW